jgi:hypothetical protein
MCDPHLAQGDIADGSGADALTCRHAGPRAAKAASRDPASSVRIGASAPHHSRRHEKEYALRESLAGYRISRRRVPRRAVRYDDNKARHDFAVRGP